MATMGKATAILLAAGKGERCGTATQKQFIRLFGKEIWRYAWERLNESGLFKEIIVVTPQKFGGPTRQASVKNALNEVRTEFVIVHDAVRPFIDSHILQEIISALKEVDAVGVVLPLVDTALEVTGDKIISIPDRSLLRLSQTPQGFKASVLRNALDRADVETTELLELVHRAGGKTKLLEGSPWYFKITTKPDLYAAKGWLLESEQRVAIVTGASRGIGVAIAKGLEDVGYKVARMSRTHGVDVRDAEAVDDFFRGVAKKYGKLSCLVNNAGIGQRCSLADLRNKPLAYDDARLLFETNFWGTLNCSLAALDFMNRGGIIVNIGSSSIERPLKGLAIYGASKAATMYLSQVMALEAREQGVSVFTVCPRRTRTELRRQMFGEEHDESLLEPEDVAEFVVQLCVENSYLLSGQTFLFQVTGKNEKKAQSALGERFGEIQGTL